MKAIVKIENAPGLNIVDLPKPSLLDNEILIKVRAVSICGSDISIYLWDDPWTRNTIKPRQIIGHEFSGIVEEVGKEVSDFSVGQKVTAEGHLYCGNCFYCTTGQAHICENQHLVGFDSPGAFAEYIAVPSHAVVGLDETISFELGAMLDPLGNALHAVSKANLLGSHVLVTGCGPIGLMTIMLANLAGARTIVATDISKYRLDLAKRIGADKAIFPHEIRDRILSDSSLGFDVWFEMSGSPDAIGLGLRSLRGGGHAILLGLPKSSVSVNVADLIVAKNITINGVVGREIKRTWWSVKRLLKNKDFRDLLGSLITHRFSYDAYEAAFELAVSRQCGKIILSPIS